MFDRLARVQQGILEMSERLKTVCLLLPLLSVNLHFQSLYNVVICLYFVLDVLESDDLRLISDEVDKAHNYKQKVRTIELGINVFGLGLHIKSMFFYMS